MLRKSVLLVGLAGMSFGISAQTIKVDEVMKNKIQLTLENDRSHPLIAYARSTCPSGWYGRTICRGVMSLPNAYDVKDLLISDYNINYSEIKPASIPTTVEVEHYSVRNCTSLPKTMSNNVTITYSESDTVSMNERFTTVSGANISAKIEVADWFNIDAGANYQHTHDLSSSSSSTRSVVRTVNESFSEVVPPYTALVYSVSKKFSQAYIDFDGSVFIDGTIFSAFNEEELGNIDQYFDFEPITISGKIWNVSHKAIDKTFVEIPLAQNYQECRAFDLNQTGWFGSEKVKELGEVIPPITPPDFGNLR